MCMCNCKLFVLQVLSVFIAFQIIKGGYFFTSQYNKEFYINCYVCISDAKHKGRVLNLHGKII